MAEVVVTVEPAPEIVVQLSALGLPGPPGQPGADSTVPGPPGPAGAAGGVTSVNTFVGDVTLRFGDVGADESGAADAAVAALDPSVDLTILFDNAMA